MSNIIVFNSNEQEIVNIIEDILQNHNMEGELTSVQNNRMALIDLSLAISLYPSILGNQNLGKASRSVETLVDTLCLEDLMDLILHIPTKAILGQSFSLAKINFFVMVLYLTNEIEELNKIRKEILGIISANIFILMAEDVYISVLSDKSISYHIRVNAGYMLANLWEKRLDHGVKEFAPVLINIWYARENLNPAYGTMLGISELFTITSQVDTVWLDFLQRDELSEDEIESLQEFLMGMSHEDMELIKNEMRKTGKSSISKNEVDIIMGEQKIYIKYDSDDPRRMYKSFSYRKNNAIFRARSNFEGPKKTIEEYIMCYLLSRPE